MKVSTKSIFFLAICTLLVGNSCVLAKQVKKTKRVKKTSRPTSAPTKAPTKAPKKKRNKKAKPPTPAPTGAPAPAPTPAPTGAPTPAPTGAPTPATTRAPTSSPTDVPTQTPDSLITMTLNYCASDCDIVSGAIAEDTNAIQQFKIATAFSFDPPRNPNEIEVTVEILDSTCDSGVCSAQRYFRDRNLDESSGGPIDVDYIAVIEDVAPGEAPPEDELEENLSSLTGSIVTSLNTIILENGGSPIDPPVVSSVSVATPTPNNSTLAEIFVRGLTVSDDTMLTPLVPTQTLGDRLQEVVYTDTPSDKDRLLNSDLLLPVYWVNLDRSVARRMEMERMFTNLTAMGHQLRPERISAKNIQDLEQLLEEGRFIPNGYEIVPTDGEESWMKHQRNQYPTVEVACLLSHLHSVLRAYQNGDEIALVLEDDAVLKDEFLSDWQELAKSAPSDWNILQLAVSNDAVLKQTTNYGHDPWIRWQPEYYCATGYLITREGMEQVLKHTLKETKDGLLHWHVDEPEVVVADELVYYLAGRAYTSTFPLVSTTGLDSEFGDSHGLFDTAGFTYQKKRVLKRQESILVLMSCRLADETQIADEVERLKVDIESFSAWNDNFRWIVNAVIVEQRLVPIFEEKMMSVQNEYIEIRSRVDPEPFNKFELIADVVDEMDRFDYVLIKDNDMRLAGFAWNSFMEKKGDSVITGALHQSLEESLARNLGKPKRQYYEFHEGQMWKYLSVPEYTNLIPIPTLFLEMGFALLEADFAAWFFNQVLDTHFLSQRSDWGIDKMWCGAAKTFRPESPSCSLVPIPVTHDDSQQLPVGDENEELGMKAFAHFRETPLFRDWMDSMSAWEKFIGAKSSLQTVLERCRAMLYDEKKGGYDLSLCASKFVGGEKKVPGNMYTCGWDMLGLGVFPDYTYQGVWKKDGLFYTEDDIIVADLHGSCVSTGDFQKSMLYMAEHFPGKILYVNGESHGNIQDFPELNIGNRAYQIGVWKEEEYAQSLHVYVLVMSLFVVDQSKWSWIFDPAQRQVNNGKNHAVAYFVSNCLDFRQNAAKELANVVEVQYGGGCSVESENARRVVTEKTHWTENWMLFRDYKYCMVLENSNKEGYMTEKILMAFLGGCMPIYWGAEDSLDVFNKEAFIWYDPENPETALEKMRRFEEDPEAYNNALKQPILKDGENTIRKYFSMSDTAPGGSELKNRIRKMMGLDL